MRVAFDTCFFYSCANYIYFNRFHLLCPLFLTYFPLKSPLAFLTQISLPRSLSGSSIRVTLSHLSAMRREMCVYATVSSIWSMLSVLHIPVQISYGYAFLFLSHPLSPQCSPSKRAQKRLLLVCGQVWDNPYPATTERRKSTALTWRQSEGRERQSGGNRETKKDISPEELHEYNSKVLSQS